MTNTSSPGSIGTSALASVDDEITEPTSIMGDGRTMRRRRNRDAVIASLIGLINEGDLDPTVTKIADRAGVSHRSIFRYFDDLNDLALTAIQTEFRAVFSTLMIAEPGQGTREQRVDQLIDTQLRTLERTHTLGRVARSKSVQIPEIDHGLQVVHEFRLDQIKRQFAIEFETMVPDRADAIAMTIVVILGFEGFDMYRRTLGHSVDEVRSIWTMTLHSLLD